MKEWINIFAEFVLFILIIWFIASLSYEQGVYNGRTDFCPSKELFEVDGDLVCGEPNSSSSDKLFLFGGGEVVFNGS